MRGGGDDKPDVLGLHRREGCGPDGILVILDRGKDRPPDRSIVLLNREITERVKNPGAIEPAVVKGSACGSHLDRKGKDEDAWFAGATYPNGVTIHILQTRK